MVELGFDCENQQVPRTCSAARERSLLRHRRSIVRVLPAVARTSPKTAGFGVMNVMIFLEAGSSSTLSKNYLLSIDTLVTAFDH